MESNFRVAADRDSIICVYYSQQQARPPEHPQDRTRTRNVGAKPHRYVNEVQLISRLICICTNFDYVFCNQEGEGNNVVAVVCAIADGRLTR